MTAVLSDDATASVSRGRPPSLMMSCASSTAVDQSGVRRRGLLEETLRGWKRSEEILRGWKRSEEILRGWKRSGEVASRDTEPAGFHPVGSCQLAHSCSGRAGGRHLVSVPWIGWPYFLALVLGGGCLVLYPSVSSGGSHVQLNGGGDAKARASSPG